VYLLV